MTQEIRGEEPGLNLSDDPQRWEWPLLVRSLWCQAGEDGCPPNIGGLLARPMSDRDAITSDIVQADIQERRSRQKPWSIDDYLAMLPDLMDLPETRQMLLMAAMESQLTEGNAEGFIEVCLRRFPEHSVEIETIATLAKALHGTMPGQVALRAGDRRGKYTLLEMLGSGAYAQTWRARDNVLQREVALKVLTPRYEQLVDRQRFLQEARALARVNHANVVGVHDASQFAETGEYFLDMQLVGQAQSSHQPVSTGFQTLEIYLGKSFRLSSRDCAKLIAEVANGLAAIHAQGLTHRDIKPANVLLDQNKKPILADFGFAGYTNSQFGNASQAYMPLVGSPGYMAPEVARREPTSPLSDIFSLGATLQGLLLGEEPRASHGEGLRRFIAKIGQEPMQMLSERDKGIPGTLAAICDRATAFQPCDRYSSASELAQDLNAYLEHQPTKAAAPLAIARFLLWYRRNALIATVGIVTLLILVLGTTAFLFRLEREKQIARAAEQEANRQRDAAIASRNMLQTQNAFVARTMNSARGQRGLGPQGKDFTVGETVEMGLRRAELTFAERPLEKAAVLHFLGQADMAIGETQRGRVSLEESLVLREANLGYAHQDTIATRRVLADLLNSLGETRQALAMYESVSNDLQELNTDQLPEDGLWAQARLAMHQATSGEDALAITRLERIAAAFRTLEYNGGMDQQNVLNYLVMLYSKNGKLEAALATQREIMALNVARLGQTDISTLNATQALAKLLTRHGRLAEADMIYKKLVPQLRQVVGPKHVTYLLVALNAGEVAVELGDPEAQERTQAVKEDCQSLSPGNEYRLRAIELHARSLEAAGEIQQCEQILFNAVKAALEQSHRHEATLNQLVERLESLLQRQQRLDEIESLRRRIRGE